MNNPHQFTSEKTRNEQCDSSIVICRKADGTPRTTYENFAEARVALLLARQYGQRQQSYNCRICNGIHIRPVGTPAPAKYYSHCKKNGYESEEDARLVAKRRYKKDGISLVVYSCPYSSEFHLTKA